jgi:hypothetical protein
VVSWAGTSDRLGAAGQTGLIQQVLAPLNDRGIRTPSSRSTSTMARRRYRCSPRRAYRPYAAAWHAARQAELDGSGLRAWSLPAWRQRGRSCPENLPSGLGRPCKSPIGHALLADALYPECRHRRRMPAPAAARRRRRR